MVTVPDGVTFQVDGKKLTARGPGGEVQKTVARAVDVKLEGKEVGVKGSNLALVNTTESIVANMLEGASKGFRKELKLLYAHFPISVEVKGKDIHIKNFLGEKTPRKTKIFGNAKVEVKGQSVTVSGADKEEVGQTVANLKRAMRISKKDPRIFQDGIFESAG